jgi:hypothetical protein
VATEWFYQTMGDCVGPLTASQVREHAEAGRISLDTYVRKGRDGRWVLADRIKGLFDQPKSSLVSLQAQTVGNDDSPGDNAEIKASTRPVYSMAGVQDLLEVFEDCVTITPKGILGFLNKGLKGTKELPFSSIIAVQFKEAGVVFSGYLQFTIPGGNESKGGLMAAAMDENTFMFAHAKNNKTAKNIKSYIDRAIRDARLPQASVVKMSLSEELEKLAALNAEGILSDEEFQAAKRKLIS